MDGRGEGWKGRGGGKEGKGRGGMGACAVLTFPLKNPDKGLILSTIVGCENYHVWWLIP